MAGKIPDPFVGLNEEEVQWVGQADWLYTCRFDVPATFFDEQTITLCCDGLDTVATVWLNGVQVWFNDNMFVPQRVTVTSLVQPGVNELCVRFESVWKQGKEREQLHGTRVAWNTDPSRVYVRKAQYHYGWDWGPCLTTAGPWLPVRLEAYSARIVDVMCPIHVDADLHCATMPVSVTVEQSLQDVVPLRLQLELYNPQGECTHAVYLTVDGTDQKYQFQIPEPQLWWPHQCGPQSLYELHVKLVNPLDGHMLDERQLRLGVRRLRLLQEAIENEAGTTFLFEINNIPLFCGGANWIPADSFLPRVNEERYRTLLTQAVDAHMTMIRVWGGGIYEHDCFYELCDELGLLVWQDFMFACGLYPAHDNFIESVRAEAEAQIRRLRHHPSLVLWCGNNEDYQLAGGLGIYDPTTVPDADSAFPARVIYEQLLPDLCAELDATTPYWPGSPYGGADVNDPTIGDRHTWDVWHGEMAPYQDYPHLGGRFVSEFGMAALPEIETIKAFAPIDDPIQLQNIIDFHQKAEGGEQRLMHYIVANLPVPTTLDEFIYASQLVQSEALGAAYRGWRRGWGTPDQRRMAGALVWQLNDCWPAVSWSIIDYALRPKPAYYTIRRALAPFAVGLSRVDGHIEVWCVHSGLALVDAQLELSRWTLDGVATLQDRCLITLQPNQITEFGSWPDNMHASEVWSARLLVDGAVVARTTAWPEPLKVLPSFDPEIQVTLLAHDRLMIGANSPVKGVWLSTEGRVHWKDNMLDLVPDDPQIIEVYGLKDQLTIRWLSDTLSYALPSLQPSRENVKKDEVLWQPLTS